MLLVKINMSSAVIWEIFPSFSYFATYFTSLQASEIIAKYEKRGNLLPILNEATCDNYFIVKYLFKLNVARVTYLLIASLHNDLIQFNANLVEVKTAITKTGKTFPGYISIYIFQYKYFGFCSFVLHSTVFCN